MNRSHLRSLLALGGFALILIGLFIWSRVIEKTSYVAPEDAEAEIVRLEAGLPNAIQLPPIRSFDPSRGSTNTSALLVVEFGDFNCLHCRLLEPELRQAMQAFPDKARLVWRDFPLNADQADGLLPAQAARCAQDQGKFWEMHDALFASAKLDRKGVSAAAQNAGLDSGTFENCIDTNKHAAELRAELEIARQSGITGSPTLFVGNQVINGVIKAQDLANLIGQLVEPRSAAR